MSKVLAKPQRKLSIPVLECMAIVLALRKFRDFVYGTHFTIFSDHYGLQFLKSKQTPSPQMQRWWWKQVNTIVMWCIARVRSTLQTH